MSDYVARFERYRGLAIHIAASYTRRINRGDIGSDIRQEALLGLWKACAVCANPATFPGYVSRRVNGEILDFLRRQDTSREAARRERATGEKRPKIVAIREARGISSIDASPEDQAIASDFSRKVQEAIVSARLTERQSQVMIYIYRYGMTQGDLAVMLGLTYQRIGQVRARAIQKIKVANEMRRKSA